MINLHFICLTFIRSYLFGKMHHWSVDPSDARSWYTNKWTSVIQLIKPLSNWLEQPFIQAACTFDYLYRFWIFVTCVSTQSHCYWIPHLHNHIVTAKLIEIRNKKRVIQVIRLIVRILFLPRIQWVMIQVIGRYETNSFFSVEISWITRITDPSAQINRLLMSIIWVLR